MSEPSDDIRRKQLRFRAWHRGMREMDLILGNFADRALGEMTGAELDAFERLLELPDQELFSWISGSMEAPGNNELLARLKELHLKPADYN